MNILYSMLGVNIPIEFRNGLYYCNDRLYIDQLYAKKAFKLKKFIDSIKDDKEVIKFVDKYKHSHDIIMKERMNKLSISSEFKQFIATKMREQEE